MIFYRAHVLRIALFAVLLEIVCMGITAFAVPVNKFTEEELYELALLDAKTIMPSEVSSKLTALVPWNPYILWDKEKNRVRIVSFMDTWALNYYLNRKNVDAIIKEKSGSMTIDNVVINLNDRDLSALRGFAQKTEFCTMRKSEEPLSSYTHGSQRYAFSWVTAVPEVLTFLHKYSSSKGGRSVPDLIKRLNQRLGLPPKMHTDSKVLVEQIIDIHDLLRPSLDPEIVDTVALQNFDKETLNLYNATGDDLFDMSKYTNINILEDRAESLNKNGHPGWKQSNTETKEDVYKKWFNNNGVYNADWSMPWTRLGYTYDYNQSTFGGDNHFGFSEFCVKPETKVTIVGIYSIDEYAKKFNEYQKIIKKQWIDIIKKHFEAMEESLVPYEKDFEQLFMHLSKKINAYIAYYNLIKTGEVHGFQVPSELEYGKEKRKKYAETLKVDMGKYIALKAAKKEKEIEEKKKLEEIEEKKKLEENDEKRQLEKNEQRSHA
jgi:hypothetical protein